MEGPNLPGVPVSSRQVILKLAGELSVMTGSAKRRSAAGRALNSQTPRMSATQSLRFMNQ